VELERVQIFGKWESSCLWGPVGWKFMCEARQQNWQWGNEGGGSLMWREKQQVFVQK
jgi:hypothetical protein